MKNLLIGVMMFLGMMLNANAGPLGHVVDESINGVEDVTDKTAKTTVKVVDDAVDVVEEFL